MGRFVVSRLLLMHLTPYFRLRYNDVRLHYALSSATKPRSASHRSATSAAGKPPHMSSSLLEASPMVDTTENKPKASEKLPPGMVLGPDGKPCKICTAFRNWTPVDNKSNGGSSANGDTQKKSTRSMMAAFASGTGIVPSGPPENCPPDVEVLGRSTWTFLHTTAAYYPERPTPTQRANMLGLLHALPVLYPCSHCASHLGENMKINPPDVSSRLGLSRWLCEQHNEVNERLGKKRFDCVKVDERWKDGPKDGSCD